MNKKLVTISTVAISCMFIFSNIPNSDAKLWDYVIDVELSENSINNQFLIGTVVDHAYNPISDVNVKVTFAGKSYLLKTNVQGEFGKELNTNELKPRTYSVLISAFSDDGKKGMTKTIFQVDGHQGKDSPFDRQLDSLEMVNDISKLRFSPNDPIAVILYDHYLDLQEKITQAQLEEKLLGMPNENVQQARQLAQEKLVEALKERPPTDGKFNQSSKLSAFLNNLDDEKRMIFELQLNSTKLRYAEAQSIMNEVLINGGSYGEARQAYLDHMSMTQKEMNSVIEIHEKTKNSIQTSSNSTKN